MTRDQLEHLIRAASTIAGDDDIVILGSQAILGSHPHAPASLLASGVADVYPLHHPDRADLIDGSIGEGSPFHETFGYHAQGVGERTAVLPAGWRERLVLVRGPGTRGASGWTLEIHDRLVAKRVAGREKDLDFAAEALRHGLARPELLCERLAATDVDPALRPIVQGRIERAAAR